MPSAARCLGARLRRARPAGYFRITPLAGPNVLAALDRQGWIEDDLNFVMAMPLRKTMRPVAALTQSFDHTDADWIGIQTEMAGTTAKREALEAMLAKIKAPARVFLAYDTDLKPVAANLVVNADGIGFFSTWWSTRICAGWAMAGPSCMPGSTGRRSRARHGSAAGAGRQRYGSVALWQARLCRAVPLPVSAFPS